jgi:cytochrome c553
MFALVALCHPAGAAEPAVAILQKNCASCHGAAQMSGFDVRGREALLRGGKRGAAVVPGHSADSLLFRAVSREGDLKMPPGKSALSPDEIATIRSWIDAGAPWDGAAAKVESTWWSFRPLKRPAPPKTQNASWVRNPIDAFVLAKLEEKRLKPTAEASKLALVRRLYFDLHGIPPTPAQVDEFVNDSSADAYPKLVDKLLASPRYGERWGRLWLDVVRYADTGGYETDILYANAWRYRDYVIDSFNQDKPYTEFVQEQIAADEIWPDNLDLNGAYELPPDKVANIKRRIGTGLYTVGPMAVEYTFFGDQYRAEWQAEAVETTGSAFLGLTVGCARCHDHKFDPITQRDYYRMAAVFAGSEDREIPIVSQMGVYEYTRYQARLVAADQIKQKIIDLEGSKGAKRELTPAMKDEKETLLRQLGEAYYKAPVMYAKANVLAHSEIVPESHILLRGDFKQKGERVTPGLPAALDGEVEIDQTNRRKGLAKWLTSPDHPLFARVMVNRIWQGHFGRGIVSTSNDFGRQGEAPTHPELLDWLADEFAAQGYSIKAMHRLMLLSNSYRMGSAPNESNSAIDADNRYLWRMNRRRLQAEELRDSVLHSAGALNLKAGGPSIAVPLSEEERSGMRDFSQWPVHPDPLEHDRRRVYLQVKRSFRLPMFEAFDQPDAVASCSRRDSSTVAPQALTLMNSEFMTKQAARLADRIRKESGAEQDSWIETGTRIVFGRAPSPAERQRLRAFLTDNDLASLCLLWFNTNEYLYVD